MKKIIDFKTLWPHLVVVVGFVVLSLGYMSPLLKNKALRQTDNIQGSAAAHEIQEYAKETGEYTAWTNTMFSGMPSYFVGGNYAKGIFKSVQNVIYPILYRQGNYIFYYLFGIYLLLMAMGCSITVSILGAVGFSFFSYNIQIIEAGHEYKVYALAFVPIMLAGLVTAFRGRIWVGVAMFSLGLGLELNANHPQITLYSAIVVGIFGIFELVRAIRTKTLKNFITVCLLAIVFGAVVTATSTARLWTTYDYTKSTMRGGSELKSTATKNAVKSEGLDKDYAFQWSYGVLESLTLLIPDFSGGASGGELNEKSETYNALVRNGVAPEQSVQVVQSFPSYWGDQRFVGGGVYTGAIMCFLFVLGLFYADNRYKYPFAVGALVTLMVSWGGNFPILNYFLFDYVPMFNKLRSVSMAMSLVSLCVAVVVAMGLKGLFETKPTWAEFKKPFYISLGLTAGVALVLALVPSLVGLRSVADTAFIDQMTQSFNNNRTVANDIYNALVEDRASMLRADALRSLIFILIAGTVLWAFVTDKLKNTIIVSSILAFLVLFDLWTVNKRYLNADDFQPRTTSLEEVLQPSATDQQILQDKDPNYRVFDVTTDVFNNASPSYFHKLIGGYSPTKLGRYQELIENQIAKNNMSVLNMLNAKYFVVPDANKQPVVQRNPDVLGNAWFVREIKMVNDANEEMKALDTFNPRTTAIVDKKFTAELNNAKPSSDTSATIRQTSYKANALTYESSSNSAQIAVFSEIFYQGNRDWKSYIDDKETPHFRANYVLRAMAIPAGKHTISFKFDPPSIVQGQQIDRWASIAWVALVVLALFMDYRSRK
jgi:hypothetical protein